ncbi:LysR substrate-binding domain-containing protein [Variovorax sp. LjRoot178]
MARASGVERCDVGFVILPMSHSSTHGERPTSTRMVCVMPSDHPLAKRKRIRPADLAGE